MLYKHIQNYVIIIVYKGKLQSMHLFTRAPYLNPLVVF